MDGSCENIFVQFPNHGHLIITLLDFLQWNVLLQFTYCNPFAWVIAMRKSARTLVIKLSSTATF